MNGISHASFQQKNYRMVYQILHAWFTQPAPVYTAAGHWPRSAPAGAAAPGPASVGAVPGQSAALAGRQEWRSLLPRECAMQVGHSAGVR